VKVRAAPPEWMIRTHHGREPGTRAARAGRSPRGRAELDDDAVAFVARQVGVPASDLGFYDWAGSTIEYHRAQIRRHLGFRECTAEDAGKLTEWLAASVCPAERRPDRVQEELLAQCRAGQIEPPPAGRCGRIIRSALHQAEQALTARVTGWLGPDASARLAVLAAAADDDDDEGDGDGDSVVPSALALPASGSQSLGLSLDWAREHLEQPLTVEDLARQAMMSPRTHARRFRETTGTMPLQWLCAERVRRAQDLLENTDDTIERIAAPCGFGTAHQMRTHFTRISHVTPHAYQ
jgi:AraC-like DNA-binding protein